MKDQVTWNKRTPATALKAWVEVVADILPEGIDARRLALRASVARQSVHYAIQGRQCGPTVAQQLAQTTGLDPDTLMGKQKQSSWVLPIPLWVQTMAGELDG